MEYIAFFVAFRYYIWLRKRSNDKISNRNRLSIILGAILGAFIGSRLVGFLENPLMEFDVFNLFRMIDTKSIMGGLFGGMLGVEISKKAIGEKQSSGDLFTYPVIVGIIIGRIGCFLSGTNEFTYGISTDFAFGMDLGDGLSRHPTSLYEIVFLIFLFFFLKRTAGFLKKEDGLLFKAFMLSYFGFRFLIEFIKPNVFYVFGMSSIQWICIICWLYYLPTLNKTLKNAYSKIHLLRLHD